MWPRPPSRSRVVGTVLATATAAVSVGLSSAIAGAAVGRTVVAPASGFTATATTAAGTLSYQGPSVDRGTPVLVFTAPSLTLTDLAVSTPCQSAGTGVTTTESSHSTSTDLQGSAGQPVTLDLTNLDADGLAAPFTVANPPPTGYTLDAPTHLNVSGTLITASTASGQRSDVAVIC